MLSAHTISIGPIAGGTGGAGGAAVDQGGTGGVGQGPSFIINTQSAIFNGNGYSAISSADKERVNVACPPPSKYFEGREDILLQLKDFFGTTSREEQIIVLLHGLGGVGKTQIALKFITSSPERFTQTFKITAQSAETIDAGYQSIAKAQQVGTSMEHALTWLQSNTAEWVLLMDNADNPQLNLEEYLPKCCHGNILITSRNPAIAIHTGDPDRSILVSDLDVATATTLFFKISRVDKNKTQNGLTSQQLLEELHFFPLAIVQAAAYISKSPHLQQDVSKYLKLYHQNQAKILSHKPAQWAWDYESTIYTTWQISFEQLPLHAQKLLQLCSFLHFEGIIEEIFENAAKYKIEEGLLEPKAEDIAPVQQFLAIFLSDEHEWDALKFSEVLDQITGFSLLTWNSKGYSMHPLVHAWVRMKVSDKAEMKSLAVYLLGMCAKTTKAEMTIMMHVMSLESDDVFIAAGFYEDVFYLYRSAGNFQKALTFASEWRDRSAMLYGSDHMLNLKAVGCLALAYNDMGMYSDAQHLEEHVFEQHTQVLGADHWETILSMSNLALTYSKLGHYQDALSLQEAVLVKSKKTLESHHPNIDRFTSNLASTYSHLGRYQKALALEEQVLENRRQACGITHPSTLLSMSNLADSYTKLGRHQEALRLEEQILHGRKERFGPMHPSTITTMSNLAATYSNLDRHQEALSIREEVLDKSKQVLGPDHPDTLVFMNNLASTYSALDRTQDALRLEEEVLEKRRKSLGRDHPATIVSMNNLATTYSDLGRHQEALILQEEVFEKRKQLFGPAHPKTILSMSNLAFTYSDLGRYRDALRLEEQALETNQQVFGPDHPDTILAMGNLASTYSDLEQYEDALRLNGQVLEKRRQTLGPDHSDTLLAMSNLASNYSELGRYQDALQLEEQVLEKRRLILGATHSKTLLSMGNLASTYRDLGRDEDALLLEEQLEALEEKDEEDEDEVQ